MKRWLSTDNTGKFKEKLRRVLWAYANHNPNVGYCQGLNRIACLALEHLSEEVCILVDRASSNRT